MPDYDPRIKGDKKVNKQLFWGINWLFYQSLWPFSYPYYQEQIIKKEWYGQGDTHRHKCQPAQSEKRRQKVNK